MGRRWLTIITIFLLSHNGNVLGDDAGQISDYLRFPNRLEPAKSCPVQTRSTQQDSDLLFMRKKPFNKDVMKWLCSELDIENVCNNVNLHCSWQYGTSNCWSSDPTQQKKRFNSERLREQIFEYAANFFHSVVNDFGTQQTCCGNDGTCIKQFGRTKIQVVRGLPANSAYGMYKAHILGHTVLVAEAALLNCFNEDCIEALIFHELGHSCQWSRRHGSLSTTQLDLNDACVSIVTSKEDFQKTLGTETASCIIRSLEDEARKTKSKCLGSWAMEAFADAVFINYRSSPLHFAWECVSPQDRIHAQSQVYLPCLIKRPDFKESFCKSQGPKIRMLSGYYLEYKQDIEKRRRRSRSVNTAPF